MLVAGAGYGKTTLAEQWAAQKAQVAWVRAKRSSADVAVLARQVAAAAAEILPGSDHRLSERLNATADPADELDVLVDLLSQDMADWPDDAWIIIDDYHLLKESATAEAFVEGIVQQSPVQVLIATRDRPTWVSTRAVLYGEVLEIGQSMLAMSEDEVEEMLAGAHDGISSGLLALAGGWPAVIGLASLTTTRSRSRLRASSFPSSSTSSSLTRSIAPWSPTAGPRSGCSRPHQALIESSLPSCSVADGRPACAPRRLD